MLSVTETYRWWHSGEMYMFLSCNYKKLPELIDFLVNERIPVLVSKCGQFKKIKSMGKLADNHNLLSINETRHTLQKSKK